MRAIFFADKRLVGLNTIILYRAGIVKEKFTIKSRCDKMFI